MLHYLSVLSIDLTDLLYFQASLDSGDCDKIRVLMRFLTALVRIFCYSEARVMS